VILQIVLGTLVPLSLLAATQLFRIRDAVRRVIYMACCGCILVGIFAMRWNVVIGGQLFSKSFLGYTSYKLDFVTREGLLPAILLLLLPFAIFVVLVKVLPPWTQPISKESSASSQTA
jgi:hypothetical protein